MRASPRTTLPGTTRPPRRMRTPGFTCFSTTSVGELKNTIESFSANSTRPTASPSTPTPAAIKAKRRCLRVMIRPSSFEAKLLNAIIEAPQLAGLGRERAACVGRGILRLVALAQHHIRAHEPQPALHVGTVLAQARGEPLDHAARHLHALLRRHGGGRGHILGAGTGRRLRTRLFDPRERFS